MGKVNKLKIKNIIFQSTETVSSSSFLKSPTYKYSVVFLLPPSISFLFLRDPNISVLFDLWDIWENWEFSILQLSTFLFCLSFLLLSLIMALSIYLQNICFWFLSWIILWNVSGSALHCKSWPCPCFWVLVPCHCPHHWFRTHCI